MVVGAAIGIATATYLIGGLVAISKVRSGRFSRGLAVVVLLGLAILTMILPVPILLSAITAGASLQGVHLFQGEGGLGIFLTPVFMFWLDLAAFAVFLPCVFNVSKPSA